ncbi:MAG: NUDIX domain-containing protein [Bacteroidales bacterium]|nr:NUDIX domain-containing protein [Bacteroidales bacterium]
MELLELYDSDLKPTGQTIERGQPIPKGLMIPIVAVFIYNNEGKYLIQKVAARKGNYYSTTAGHVQAGERDFTVSMLREIKEEIGLSVTKSELKLLKIRRYNYKFTLLYMLKSNVPIELLKLQPEEVESAQWMSRDEIELLCKDGLFNKIHYQLLLDCEERLSTLHLKTKNRS